jgi:hypothetical protein
LSSKFSYAFPPPAMNGFSAQVLRATAVKV